MFRWKEQRPSAQDMPEKVDPVELLAMLHYASSAGRTDAASEALRLGADLNGLLEVEIGGRMVTETALHAASKCGNVDIVRLLLTEGADASVQDSFGFTAVQSAAGMGVTMAFTTEMCQRAARGDARGVAQILTAGLDPNIPDAAQNTAMHWACAYRAYDVADCLIRFGADVNSQNAKGDTPLNEAENGGADAIVNLLFSMGARRGNPPQGNQKTRTGPVAEQAPPSQPQAPPPQQSPQPPPQGPQSQQSVQPQPQMPQQPQTGTHQQPQPQPQNFGPGEYALGPGGPPDQNPGNKIAPADYSQQGRPGTVPSMDSAPMHEPSQDSDPSQGTLAMGGVDHQRGFANYGSAQVDVNPSAAETRQGNAELVRPMTGPPNDEYRLETPGPQSTARRPGTAMPAYSNLETMRPPAEAAREPPHPVGEFGVPRDTASTPLVSGRARTAPGPGFMEDSQAHDEQKILAGTRNLSLQGPEPNNGPEQPPMSQPQMGMPQSGLPQMGSPQTGPPQMGPPQMGQPQMGQPQMGQPQMNQPQMNQPQMNQPQMGQPQMNQPQMGQPQMGQPQMGQPQMGRPQTGPPQVGQPQMDPPQMGQPQTVQPQMDQPQMNQPQMGQPEMSPPQMAQAPMGQPPMGQQPMGQPPMGQPPMGQQPMGQPPMGQPPMGQPPMGQPPMGQPPMGQPPMGQPPMGQPPMGQPPMGQPPMGQPPMGQPPMGQPPMGQPPMGQPPMGQPPMGQPPMGQPQNNQSPMDQPQMNHQYMGQQQMPGGPPMEAPLSNGDQANAPRHAQPSNFQSSRARTAPEQPNELRSEANVPRQYDQSSMLPPRQPDTAGATYHQESANGSSPMHGYAAHPQDYRGMDPQMTTPPHGQMAQGPQYHGGDIASPGGQPPAGAPYIYKQDGAFQPPRPNMHAPPPAPMHDPYAAQYRPGTHDSGQQPAGMRFGPDAYQLVKPPIGRFESEPVWLQSCDLDPKVGIIAPQSGRGHIQLSLNKNLFGGREQAYRLSVRPTEIDIVGSDAAGLFYGCCSLDQLVRLVCSDGGRASLPCCAMSDWPSLPNRGVLLDISRSKVLSPSTLRQLIERLARLKYNQVQLYMEHTFAYLGHEEIWRDSGAISAEEIMALDGFCRELFVELIPCQSSLAGFNMWLKNPRYTHLAECPDEVDSAGFDTSDPRGRMSLCPIDYKTIEFITDLYEQLLPCFSSSQLNVGLDRAVDLGRGRSAQAIAAKGIEAVTVRYLRDIAQVANRQGKHTVQFWSDVLGDLLDHQNDLSEFSMLVPPGVIAMERGSEPNHPFDSRCYKLASIGVPFMVCPSTSSNNSFGGKVSSCLENIRKASQAAVKNSAVGMLVTDSGENGHLQPLAASYPGFIAGAGAAWNSGEALAADDKGLRLLAALLDAHIFMDSEETAAIGTILVTVGDLHLVAEGRDDNIVVYRGSDGPAPQGPAATKLFQVLIHEGDTLSLAGLTASGLQRAQNRVDRSIDLLNQYQGMAGRIDVEEVRLIVEFLRLCVRIATYMTINKDARMEEFSLPWLPDAQRSDLANVLIRCIDQHKYIWTKRNRLEGFARSWSWLDRPLMELSGGDPRLEQIVTARREHEWKF